MNLSFFKSRLVLKQQVNKLGKKYTKTVEEKLIFH